MVEQILSIRLGPYFEYGVLATGEAQDNLQLREVAWLNIVKNEGIKDKKNKNKHTRWWGFVSEKRSKNG